MLSRVPRRVPIPPELNPRGFRVAEAIESGITFSRLRGRDLERPFRGTRTIGSGNSVFDLAAAYAPLLRAGDRFSHTTAAILWGLPLPRGFAELHVSTAAGRNPPRGKGVIGHRSSVSTAITREGLPVSGPRSMFLELATELELDDLVSVGDALILDPYLLDPHDIRPWTNIQDLASACEGSRAPGCRRARRALKLMRQGAESRPETLLRLLLIRAGLPEPELNSDIHDAAGRFLGRGDLVYRAARVIVEYDGDHHRNSKEQYENDIMRLERFRDADWIVVQVRDRGLFVNADQTIARVRRALTRAF
jgi:hypothetical protein